MSILNCRSINKCPSLYVVRPIEVYEHYGVPEKNEFFYLDLFLGG